MIVFKYCFLVSLFFLTYSFESFAKSIDDKLQIKNKSQELQIKKIQEKKYSDLKKRINKQQFFHAWEKHQLHHHLNEQYKVEK